MTKIKGHPIGPDRASESGSLPLDAKLRQSQRALPKHVGSCCCTTFVAFPSSHGTTFTYTDVFKLEAKPKRFRWKPINVPEFDVSSSRQARRAPPAEALARKVSVTVR